jgi:hypothetical protein
MIKITSRGIPELVAWLKTIQGEARDQAAKFVANYLIGDSNHGLMHEPYYKYVNRAAGFPGLGGFVDVTGYKVPVGYVSKKQHRYVMAMIAQGKIRPGQDNRTHDLANSWRYSAQGSNYKITTDVPYAKYVVGGQQTRMHGLIGWRTMAQNAKDNMMGAYRYANAQLKKWLLTKKR